MTMAQALSEPPAGSVPAWAAKGLSAAEWLFALGALFMFSEALLGPLLSPPNDPDGSPILRIAWLPIYGMTALILLLRPFQLLHALILSLPILLAVGWSLVSFQWSMDPGLSLRRAIALTMTTAFGVWLALRYDWRDLLQLLAALFLIVAIGSFLAGALVPSFGVMSEIHPGAWKGLWWEKNTLGAYMAKGAVVFACAWYFRPSRWWLWAPALMLAVLLVLLSTSKTSLMALGIGLGGMGAIWMVRRGPVTLILLAYLSVLLLAGLAAFIVLDPETFFGLLGKDPTLTGRTDIWTSLMRRIEERYWLGYGYGAFWSDPMGPAFWVREETEWPVPTAHNGWLETWLSSGLIGVLLFTAGFVWVIISAFRGSLSAKAAYFTLPSLAMFAIFSLSESSILQQNNLSWVLFVVVAVKLCGVSSRFSQPRHRNGYGTG